MASVSSSALPANEIRQTMLESLERRRQSEPHRVFAKVPVSQVTYSKGFRSITYSEVWNAVNRVAWWLDENIGRSATFDTIAYLGPGDVRYSIILLAAMKTGHKVFFPSLRNSKVAFEALFCRVNCRTLITTSPAPAPVSLLSGCGISRTLHIPSLQDLLEVQEFADYVCGKTYEEARNDPVCVLHTSGSTGIPKPLVFTNEFIAAVASNTSLEPPDGFDSPNRFLIRDTCLVTLPAFHMAGLAFTLFVPIFNDNIPLYPLPGPPPALHSFIEAVSNSDVNWALVAPLMVQALAQEGEALSALSQNVQKLFYIGGSPPKEAGDLVRKQIPLYQVFGLSELGSLPLVYRENLSQMTDWQTVEFHPQLGAQLRHRFDNLHELVLTSKSVHGRLEPAFAIFPDIEEYETGDLFSPHPEKSNSWVYESRADDVLVYSTGEKTNPVTFEKIVSGNLLVRGAVMIGEGKFESSLLVELASGEDSGHEDPALIIDSIWPSVEEANSAYPGYAQVSRSKILFTKPSIPMARTGKGTIQRRATIALYKDAIDELYSAANGVTGFEFPLQLDLTSEKSVAQLLGDLLRYLTGWSQASYDADFFALGMDSLIVMRLSHQLKQLPQLAWFEPKTVYENPSIMSLTSSIVQQVSISPGTHGHMLKGRRKVMAQILGEKTAALFDLCKDLDAQAVRTSIPSSLGQVVLLTGSTGNVGSFLLDKLIQDDGVSHIFCLNRSKNSQAVQVSQNKARGLETNLSPGRVTFLTGQLDKPDLGIPASELDLLKSKVTIIVHNAWPVDFNLSLVSFRPSLSGLVNLLSLAAHSANHASVLFLSSISATSNYGHTSISDATVPESIVSDPVAPAATGYGESKYISEIILDYATKHIGVRTGVIRVAQAAGSANSLRGWNKQEWFPTLVMTSKQICALPQTLGYADEQYPAGILGEMNWMPVDHLSGFIVDSMKTLAMSQVSDAPLVLHALNPASTTWTSILPTVRSVLSDPHNDSAPSEIKLVPYAEWVALLQSKAEMTDKPNGPGSHADTEIPGLKLLEFYASLTRKDSSMARLSTAQTEKLIPTLRACEPLRSGWMAGWIRDWLS